MGDEKHGLERDVEKKTETLLEEDIITERVLGRRSSLGVIGASIAAMAGVLGFAPDEAEAQCSDSDGGRNADPAGRGRRCGRRRRRRRGRGCSDSDGGRNADPAGRGRSCGGRRRRRSCTDQDGGRYADAAGAGRRCR